MVKRRFGRMARLRVEDRNTMGVCLGCSGFFLYHPSILKIAENT